MSKVDNWLITFFDSKRMSYTIVPNNKTKEQYFSNVWLESYLGYVCYKAGAKFEKSIAWDLIPNGRAARLAYSMTEAEAEDTVDKLLKLEIIKVTEYFDGNREGIGLLNQFIIFLKESKGYTTLT